MLYFKFLTRYLIYDFQNNMICEGDRLFSDSTQTAAAQGGALGFWNL